jgi:syntaxin of plants SYP7
VQMDTATKSVQTNNQKMKGVLTRIRSGRNFCLDIILITVLLAIAGWIYTMVG